MSTSLAEVGKKKISAAEAIQLVQKLAKDRYKALHDASSQAIAQADHFAGGQTERLDKDVIDQGRAWACRLAIIARRSAGDGYNTSKTNAALMPIVKKLFSLIGELEGVQATDVEITLFNPPKPDDFFGYNSELKKLTVEELVKDQEPGGTIDAFDIVDMIRDSVGTELFNEVGALFEGYEIEPIVVPGEPEDGEIGTQRRRRSRR